MGFPVLSAFADEYKADFDGQLEGLCKFGIKYIELRHADGINISALEPDDIVKIKKKLKAFGISVSAIGSPLGKIRADGDMEEELARARRIFAYANELECKYVRVFSYYASEKMNAEQNRTASFAALEAVLKEARRFGVTLCHENEANIYGESPETCKEIVDYFGGEIKCVFDMGNFVLNGYSPYPHAYGLLRDSIAYFHIKDALYAGAVVPAGCGEADIGSIIRAHKDYAKDGFFITLEPHLQTFSGLNALVGRSFDNPYKYENAETAFADAVSRLKALLG